MIWKIFWWLFNKSLKFRCKFNAFSMVIKNYYRKNIKHFDWNSIQFYRDSIFIENFQWEFDTIWWEFDSHKKISIGIWFLSKNFNGNRILIELYRISIEIFYVFSMVFRWSSKMHRICIEISMTYRTVVKKFSKSI